jgi:hypothetical protein
VVGPYAPHPQPLPEVSGRGEIAKCGSKIDCFQQENQFPILYGATQHYFYVYFRTKVHNRQAKSVRVFKPQTIMVGGEKSCLMSIIS